MRCTKPSPNSPPEPPTQTRFPSNPPCLRVARLPWKSNLNDGVQITVAPLYLDVVLDIQLNPNLHGREIRIDNGWIIKTGRGLDFYQKPGSWFEVGASDLSLRKCLETKADIYRYNQTS